MPFDFGFPSEPSHVGSFESFICSETLSIDLADPRSERRGLLPSHALNIKGRISKHPKKKGERLEGTGLTFIRPAAAVSRFSQIPLYFHGTCDP